MRKIVVVVFMFFLATGAFAQADVPTWAKALPPEGVLWGIGTARTESDGESILLAEDRARTSIARMVDDYNVNFFDRDQSMNFSQTSTSALLTGLRVIKRYKDKTGTWWCLVELSKADAKLGSEPAQGDIRAMLPVIQSNMQNWPDIKKAVTLNNIPGWVFDSGPRDMICAVGAAKLDNDEDVVYLAMERARRSLARSISAEIKSVVSDYNNESKSQTYQEEGVSIISVYEHTPIPVILLNQAKTRDGTLWVMVGYRTARR